MGDTTYTDEIVRWQLQQECAEKGLRKFCRKHDLDPGNVSAIINGKKNMIESVARAIGYAPITMYKRT